MRAFPPKNDFSPFGAHRPRGAMRRLLDFTQSAGLHWFAQRSALIARGVGLRRLRAAPVDVTVDTIAAQMRLYPFNNACEKRLLFTPQYADRDERAFVAAQIRPDMTFIDIGAGCGAMSLFVALRAGPGAKILAVEPQPVLFERMVFNLRQNPAVSVKALDCAVTDSEGEAILFFNPYDLAESSIRMINVEGGGGQSRVPARSLAGLAREEGFAAIDLMKLDIEGAEDLALEPFLTSEPEDIWPRALILAFSPGRWDADLPDLLKSRGYRRVARTEILCLLRTGSEMNQPKRVTAAILVIGDEILSGRTRDTNSGYIAHFLTQIGVEPREIRVVGDDQDEIVAAIDALRGRYDYLFTTGGIGPTHDDITADAVAKAFGVGIAEDERALKLLRERIKPEDLNAARRRMARIPHGAELVDNPISRAPGFWLGNVIVMAGVPAIMQAMLDGVAAKIARGAPMLSETLDAHGLPEGAYGESLGGLAKKHPEVSIGSYPRLQDGRFVNQIVLRARDAELLAQAARETATALAEIAARHRL